MQVTAKTASDSAIDKAAAMFTDVKGLITMNDDDLDKLMAALLPIGEKLAQGLTKTQKISILQGYHNRRLEDDLDDLVIRARAA
jgi:hypothetical protein